jgi:hypothetical protein
VILVSQSFSATIVGRTIASPMDLSFASAILSWHRADLGLTTGGTMTLADQSGNGHSYTRTSNQPTVEATGFNGKQSLLFNGTNQGLENATSLATDFIGGSDNTNEIIVVAQYVAVGGSITASLFGFTSSSDSDFFYQIHARGASLAPASVFRASKEDTTPTLATSDSTETFDTSRHVYLVSNTGTAIVVRRSGVALTMSGSGAMNVGTMTVNRATIAMLDRAGSESNYANLRWREQLCFSRQLTAGERTELTDLYMQPMYGLSC